MAAGAPLRKSQTAPRFARHLWREGEVQRRSSRASRAAPAGPATFLQGEPPRRPSLLDCEMQPGGSHR
eukprot:287640-Pyramimonas_sp.AAC.1